MPGLYIHIPFCKQKCNYCSFASFHADAQTREKYLSALFSEMAANKGFAADTLYIGGGTPSMLTAHELEALLLHIEDNFGPVKKFAESTFEANPESLTEEKIILLKRYGVNRFSLGLQSASDAHLKTLGRVHNADMFFKAYGMLVNAGIKNINIDLIAGAPSQTLEDFKRDISLTLGLAPRHMSIYGLQIEEGTPFFTQGVLQDQLLIRAMLEHARQALERAGMKHYEISNFAAPGFESRHNLNYWQSGEYLGLGLAAASYIKGERRQNTDFLESYLNGAACERERLRGKAALGERTFMALRCLDGTPYTAETERHFGRDVEEMITRGLLERSGGNIKLTHEGLFLANEVFSIFVAPFED